MKSNLASLMMVLVAALMCVSERANAFYDPGLQRWVNRDPIQEWGGINLYRFTRNQPLNSMDLFGLSILCNKTPDPLVVSGNVGSGHGEGNQLFGVIGTGETGGGKDHPIPAYDTREEALAAFDNPLISPPTVGTISDVDFYDDPEQAPHNPTQCDNKVIGDEQGPTVDILRKKDGSLTDDADNLTVPPAYFRRLWEKIRGWF